MSELKKMPKIALGAWAWGNDGTFGGNLAEEQLRPVFDAAMQAGLNLWDTAYAYGMGTSEKVLGEFLRTVPRDSYLISDKFTPQCADLTVDNAVITMYSTSAALLGTDYMDIYWIHNPVGAPEWTRKLIPLARLGKIGRIGLSNHNLAEIREAAEILKKRDCGFLQSRTTTVCSTDLPKLPVFWIIARKMILPSLHTWCWSKGRFPANTIPGTISRKALTVPPFITPCCLSWRS